MEKYLKRVVKSSQVQSGEDLPTSSYDSPVPNSEDASTSATSSQKQKWTSSIWNHFQKKVNADLKKAESACNYCHATLKLEHGNTSAMARHLQARHLDKYLIFESEKKADTNKPNKRKKVAETPPCQQTLETCVNTVTPWAYDNKNSIALTKTIGKWMAESLHPFSLVEQPGFIEVMKLAQPRYKIPCSTTFSRRVIPDLAREERDTLKLELVNEKKDLGSIALTSDLWTSRTNDSYLAVTGHFIRESDLSMQSVCLGQYNFKGQHSGENIAKYLDTCLQEWSLDSLTVPIFVVTDNAKNIISAIKQTQTIGLTCFAHSLQLVIKHAKKANTALTNTLAKSRALVGHFKHSAQDTEKLTAKQIEMGLQPIKVIQDVDTRWNSEYLMLNRLNEMKGALSSVCLDLEKDIGLSHSEWVSVKHYIDILKPFFEFTEQMSANRMPTRSMIIPMLSEIEGHLDKYIESHFGETGIVFAKELKKQIKSRFPLYMQNNNIDVLCTLIDPRFKDVYIPQEQKNLAISLLKQEICTLLDEHSEITVNENERSELSVAPSPSKKNTSMWATLDKLRCQKQPCNPVDGKKKKIEMEMESYLQDQLIAINDNPLQWWKENLNKFPTFKPAVKKYLCIPATEVASERTFSAAGNIVTTKREKLKESNVEDLVFLNQNLKRKRL